MHDTIQYNTMQYNAIQQNILCSAVDKVKCSPTKQS